VILGALFAAHAAGVACDSRRALAGAVSVPAVPGCAQQQIARTLLDRSGAVLATLPTLPPVAPADVALRCAAGSP